jgi:chaperonin GroEL
MGENVIFRENTSGIEGKKNLLEGLNKSCDIVSSTFGYRGTNNLYETLGGLPMITSDGWNSLQELQWENPIEQIALNILKEASKKTFEVIGDGTTGTCVLTQAFFTNSLEALINGGNSIEIKEKIEASVIKILAYLDSIATPLTPKLMFDVAKTSAHGDEDIAKFVTEAFETSGNHGIVSHKRSFTDETFIETILGNPIDSGYTHESFVNAELTQSVIFNNPLILCSLSNLQTTEEIVPFLNYSLQNDRPIVIISEMEYAVEEMVLSNVLKYKSPFCIIKPPYLGKKKRETINDISLILGCEVLSGIPRVEFNGTEASYLGTCERIEIGKKDTVIFPSKEVDTEKRNAKIIELSEQIKLQNQDIEKNYLRERISKLTGGICTILVGGITPSETDERVDRFDDAIKAVRSAKEEGVVAGGGVALMNASRLVEDIDEVSKKSIIAPFNKILSNAGMFIDIDEERIKDSSTPLGFRIVNEKFADYPTGYDVKEYKEVNMFDAGIIDTVKGLKVSLQNAVSSSNNLLRTDNIITFKRMSNGK